MLKVPLFDVVFAGSFATSSVVFEVVIWGGVLSLLFPFYYEITSSALLVRNGWIRREIPLSSIQRVFPSQNSLAVAALSLVRLKIEYTQDRRPGYVLISPRDTSSCLRDLMDRAGGLEM